MLRNLVDRDAIAVAQLGARMHYAAPRILHDAGMLSHFYTDICAVKGWPRLAAGIPPLLRPNAVKRLLGRVPDGVPRDRITVFTRFGLEYAKRRAAARNLSDSLAAHLWAGRTFCRLVMSQDLNGCRAVYGFNSAALELLQGAVQRGLAGILEQCIAPRIVENSLLEEEHERFPGWEARLGANAVTAEFAARERAEWEAADTIICGSDFVRDAIRRAGGPAEKCAVVPYGGDFPSMHVRERTRGTALRALCAGAVCLRKGAPYLAEAAQLTNPAVRFRCVGPVRLMEQGAARMSRRLELTGAVPRCEMHQHYRWADVFILPSLCEGSATVCYEALAAGLPVITTPNAGSVIRDGLDGFIVPIRDPQTIAERLIRLANNRHLLAEMSRNALLRSREYTLAEYGRRLIAALQALCSGSPALSHVR